MDTDDKIISDFWDIDIVYSANKNFSKTDILLLREKLNNLQKLYTQYSCLCIMKFIETDKKCLEGFSKFSNMVKKVYNLYEQNYLSAIELFSQMEDMEKLLNQYINYCNKCRDKFLYDLSHIVAGEKHKQKVEQTVDDIFPQFLKKWKNGDFDFKKCYEDVIVYIWDTVKTPNQEPISKKIATQLYSRANEKRKRRKVKPFPQDYWSKKINSCKIK